MPKINIGQNQGIQTNERKIKSGGTFIAQNLKKESIMLDKDGNQIDPRTKQIINQNE